MGPVTKAEARVLSVVVVARDEADRIGRCLRSVTTDAERIVVVDRSTTDDTARVAASEGATIVERPWPGHVAQKNYALGLATRPWVLSLDADEWLDERADRAIASIVGGEDPRTLSVPVDRAIPVDPAVADGYTLARCSDWLGRPIRSGKWYPDRKLRLVRRGRGRWVGDDPHDRLVVDGVIGRLPGEIRHAPYRTWVEHLATIDRYTAIHARALHGRGVRARRWDPWIRPSLHFVDAVLLRSAWRDGLDGLAVAALGSAHVHLKWARLRALGDRPA